MARTKDPSAATRKAWITRKRNRGVSEREMALRSPIVYEEELVGGVAETWRVQLDNGQECNFKLSEGGKGLPEHEVGAWEVAKLVGMDDMVPAAVILDPDASTVARLQRAIGDNRYREMHGSLAEWQDGRPVRGAASIEAKFGESGHDVRRAAMFDYIIGNQDRHGGNWLIDHGQLRLIDHNRAFGAWTMSYLLEQTRSANGDESPAEYAKPYLDKKPHIIAALRSLGLRNEQLNAVSRRIDRAASADTWRSL